MTASGGGRRRPIVVVGALSLAYEGLPADLATTRARQAAAMVERLRSAPGRPVLDLGLVADLAGAVALAPAIAAARPSAIVVLVLGAIRADVGMALAGDESIPVLVWAGQDRASYPPDHRPIDAVAGAGPVGAYALANALVRAGRPVRCEIGEELGAAAGDWVRAAGIAADLGDARFGLVGTVPRLRCRLRRRR